MMSGLDRQRSRKLLKKAASPKLNSFRVNLVENARPFEFFEFVPFESDT